MDRVVRELVEAFDRADACREGSAVVDAICHRCWDDVDIAVKAVRLQYAPEPPEKAEVLQD